MSSSMVLRPLSLLLLFVGFFFLDVSTKFILGAPQSWPVPQVTRQVRQALKGETAPLGTDARWGATVPSYLRRSKTTWTTWAIIDTATGGTLVRMTTLSGAFVHPTSSSRFLP